MDHDIRENHGLIGVDINPHTTETRVSSLRMALSSLETELNSLHYPLPLQIKLWMAKNSVMPWFVSLLAALLSGFCSVVPYFALGADLTEIATLIAFTIQFVFICTAAGMLTWYGIRFTDEESGDPVPCLLGEMRAIDESRARISEQIRLLEADLNRNCDLLRRMNIAAQSQKNRDQQIPKRKRLLSVDLQSLTGVQFEDFLKEVYEINGFQVETTPSTGDQGGDLIATKAGERICVQAKRYSEKVSNKAIQEAHAAKAYYGCNRCAVVTNSQFTKAAKKLAKIVRCDLIDGDRLRKLIIGDCDFCDLSNAQQDYSPSKLTKGFSDSPKKLTGGSTGVYPSLGLKATESENLDSSSNQYRANFKARDTSVKESNIVGDVSLGNILSTTSLQAEATAKKHAESEYPSDFEMQLHVRKEQISAWKQLNSMIVTGVPNEILQQIYDDAVKDWPNEFDMQLHKIKEQIAAYKRMVQFSAPDVLPAVLDKLTAIAKDDYPTDYEMQLYKLREQIKAYRKIRRRDEKKKL